MEALSNAEAKETEELILNRNEQLREVKLCLTALFTSFMKIAVDNFDVQVDYSLRGIALDVEFLDSHYLAFTEKYGIMMGWKLAEERYMFVTQKQPVTIMLTNSAPNTRHVNHKSASFCLPGAME